MDDVLTLTARSNTFDEDSFKADFHRSECYWDPLRLEDGGEGTFLETSYTITTDGSVKHWLKNVNDPNKETKVWRYAHYHSYTPWAVKRSVLITTLKKVDKMASDGDSLLKSALWKLVEFAKLKYCPSSTPSLYVGSSHHTQCDVGLRYAARLRSKPAATSYPKVEATDYTSRPKQNPP